MSTECVYRGGRLRARGRDNAPLVTVSLHVLKSQPAELGQLADVERNLYHHSRVQGRLFQGGYVEHAMSSPGV
jgi:hypothetical protein